MLQVAHHLSGLRSMPTALNDSKQIQQRIISPRPRLSPCLLIAPTAPMSGDDHPRLPLWKTSSQPPASAPSNTESEASTNASSDQRLAALNSFPTSRRDAPTLPSLASLLAFDGSARRRSQPDAEHERPPYTPVVVYGGSPSKANPPEVEQSASGPASVSDPHRFALHRPWSPPNAGWQQSQKQWESSSPSSESRREAVGGQRQPVAGLHRPDTDGESRSSVDGEASGASAASPEGSQVASADGSGEAGVTSTAAANEASTSPSDDGSGSICSNCSTRTTPLWRRDGRGGLLCNACGLFAKVKGRPRPHSLKTDVIKPRARKNRRQNMIHPSQLAAGRQSEQMMMASHFNPHAYRVPHPQQPMVYDGRPPPSGQAYPEMHDRGHPALDQRGHHPYGSSSYRPSPPPQQWQSGPHPPSSEAKFHPGHRYQPQIAEGGLQNMERHPYQSHRPGYLGPYGSASVVSSSIPDMRYMYRPEGYSTGPITPHPGAFYPRAAEEPPCERVDHHKHLHQSHRDGHLAPSAASAYQQRSPKRDGSRELASLPASGPSPQPRHTALFPPHEEARGRPYHPPSPADPKPHEQRDGSAERRFRLPPIALALSGQHRSVDEEPRAMYGCGSREDADRAKEA